MKFRNTLLIAAAFAFLAAGLLLTPKLRAAGRAALVEIVIPSQPFFGGAAALETGPAQNTNYNSIGLDSGTLGISQITIANTDSYYYDVSIYGAKLPGGVSCGSPVNANSVTQEGPVFKVRVQASSVLTFAYPTSLVLGAGTYHSCVVVSSTTQNSNPSYPTVYLTGFVN